ncbi:hypothetical protein [Musicola paradisiaca]|uniref:Uncharacterized protein n=1 Tax=Musicola paradisiaca (strain Ech703) TaxID=579405 RepID=C6CCV4_MUSP7|nr:hypothetical protein [Musicola paradisiaca]ACS84995.1 hypothetical protein Dd703_1191 [Musicola paradisiaca Ech703]
MMLAVAKRFSGIGKRAIPKETLNAERDKREAYHWLAALLSISSLYGNDMGNIDPRWFHNR